MEKFNPPFTNRVLSDFFDFVTDHQNRTIFVKEWMEENFPDLELELSNKVPTYYMEGKKICYLKYLWHEGEFLLEISFVKGYEMNDLYELFQPKGAKVKSILIDNLDEDFFRKLKKYIEQAMNLGME